MKLKKIASLALAGVMAVSMLAGCKGSETENNGTEGEQNQVVAATVADYANSLLSKAQKNVFEFKNSAELTTALQKVASDSEKFTSDDIESLKAVYSYSDSATAAGQDALKDLSSELKKEMDLDYDNSEYDELAATKEKGTKTAAYVYGMSGNLTEEGAVRLVIDGWKSVMNGTSIFPATATGLDFDYTAEISAVKVTAPDDKNAEVKASTWVVAIVVTQTATETNNA